MAGIEEIEAMEAGNTSWVRTAKDLFAGAAGGVAQVLLGKLLLCLNYVTNAACL